MNILFLTLFNFKSFDDNNIYCDLLREMINAGNNIYCISPTERRNKVSTHLVEDGHLLKLKIGNIQKTNVIEKGFSTLFVERRFKSAIKKYFSSVKFDIILYSTPPITLLNAIKYVKERDNAKTYLILKDIFPQNAVDLGMLKKTGLKGVIYRYFRKKEKNLYAISDRIGCMSMANIDYVIKHNDYISRDKVELFPNCIEIKEKTISEGEKSIIREKYGIPGDKMVFVYGGNIGRPQGVDFLIECLKKARDNDKAFFLIVGDGTEYKKLEDFTSEEKPKNVKLLKFIPKKDYDVLLRSCDVGLIFLDYKFTIPNFPSRLLSYLDAKLAVITVTDPSTDIGKVIEENHCGFSCYSNDSDGFLKLVETCLNSDIKSLGQNGFALLNNEYNVKVYAKRIVRYN